MEPRPARNAAPSMVAAVRHGGGLDGDPCLSDLPIVLDVEPGKRSGCGVFGRSISGRIVRGDFTGTLLFPGLAACRTAVAIADAGSDRRCVRNDLQRRRCAIARHIVGLRGNGLSAYDLRPGRRRSRRGAPTGREFGGSLHRAHRSHPRQGGQSEQRPAPDRRRIRRHPRRRSRPVSPFPFEAHRLF